MQDTFFSVIEEMKSDYFPKQEEGAEKFINLGYNLEELRKIIDEERNPHLVSMYLYICGKTKNTMTGWEYLQDRVLSEYWLYRDVDMMNINIFEKVSRKNNDQKYLFNAARKWLMTKKQFLIFLEHMKKHNANMIESRSNLLRMYNEQITRWSTIKSIDDTVMNYIRKITYAVKELADSEVCSSTVLTEREITIACEISSYADVLVGAIPDVIYPGNLYQYWLKEFFLKTVTRQIKDVDYLRGVLDKNTLKALIGIDEKYVENLYERILCKEKNTIPTQVVEKIQTDEIMRSFQKLKDNISEDIADRKTQVYYYVECLKIVEEFAKTLSDDPIRCLYIKTVVREFGKGEFKIEFLDEVLENILTYNDKYMDFLMYYFFEQKENIIGYRFDFSNTCCYEMKQDLDFFEKYLLKYLDLKYFKNDDMYRGYMALTVLINKKSEEGIKWFFDLIAIKDTLQLPSRDYFLFELKCMIKESENYNIIKKLPIGIGRCWENICFQIASKKFENDECRVIFQARFINNAIADIIVGENVKVHNKCYIFSDIIIECKKSMYFGELDAINNNTTEKYIDYCDSLHYWILEKPENFQTPNYTKVKYLFWEDICKIYDVDSTIQNQVNRLVDITAFSDKFKNLDDKNLDELVDIYQELNNLDMDSFKDILYSKKDKPKTLPKPETVIRKYKVDGTFIQEYENTKHASQQNGISTHNISAVIAKRRKTAGGYLWEKHIKGDVIGNIIPPEIINVEGHNIIQVTIDGEIVNSYDSIAEAARAVGVDRKGVFNVLNGRQKTSGGYYWSLESKKNI